jgi:peptide-methionine (R)-S-oxide reductase
MPGDPLIFKILVLSTLLVGSLSLLVNLLPAGRPHRRTRRLPGRSYEAEKSTVRKTDAQWKNQLTPEQYRVARQSGTERAFTGQFQDHYEAGTYHCVGCGQDLFDSDLKYDAGSGWPTYCQPATEEAVVEIKNISGGQVRTEVVCSRCESHLGHVYADGSQPTGLRYCINSASLTFEKEAETAAQ